MALAKEGLQLYCLLPGSKAYLDGMEVTIISTNILAGDRNGEGLFFVEYYVAWIHNGERKTATVQPSELKEQRLTRVGFTT